MKLKEKKKKCVNERERISKWIFFQLHIIYEVKKKEKEMCE
jgi:hypothetical protein